MEPPQGTTPQAEQQKLTLYNQQLNTLNLQNATVKLIK